MTYRFPYDEQSVYGNVVGLVRAHAVGRNLHLDIGCGYAAIAESLVRHGLTYVGFDVDPEAVEELQERGLAAHLIDLSDPAAARSVLENAVAGQSVSSITIIDVLEHITTGPEILAVLRQIAVGAEPAPLILSVPNVAHIDVAAKLMVGRFDYTEVGLLDRTHVRFFTQRRLGELLSETGWTQIDSADFEQKQSDQHFPDASVVLTRGSVLGTLLADVRDASFGDAIVNQFVRAYLPGAVRQPIDAPVDTKEFGLTVLVRTQGRRLHTLRDALLSLLAQTSENFEVIVLAHDVTPKQRADVEKAVAELPRSLRERTRVLMVHGGGRARPLNQGVDVARGRYFTVLDDDDIVFSHWVETFLKLAKLNPGRICRTVAVSQKVTVNTWSDGQTGFHIEGGLEKEFPDHFDLIGHVAMNQTPPMCLAFPRALVTELGQHFDETLNVVEDWDLLLRGAFLCGVANSPETTAVYRRWQDGDASHLVHNPPDWTRDTRTVLARLSGRSLVFPPGSVDRFIELIQAEEQVEALVEQRDYLNRSRAEWEAERAQMVQDYVDRGGELGMAWKRTEEWHARAAEFNETAVELAEAVRGMTESLSWRMTAPLRGLTVTVRALLRPLRRRGQ